MAMVKKSITVTSQQEAWIQSQIDSGYYGNDSEVIREALREKQMRMAELDAIREKLIAAEQSGLSERSPEKIRDQAKTRLKRDGRL